jgi:hypothetical protein
MRENLRMRNSKNENFIFFNKKLKLIKKKINYKTYFFFFLINLF